MTGYFHRVHEQTPTRFWINNVTRREADMAIEAGAVGCTQNPSYTWKMLSNIEERPYVEQLLMPILDAEPDDNTALMMLQRELVAGIAQRFLPIYEESNGRDGYVSIQGDPFHEDKCTLIHWAKYNTAPLPNIMAKIPVVEEGIEAIEEVASLGIPINATEVMAVRQALDVCQAYERAKKRAKVPARIYYSHIAGIYDEHLQNVVKRDRIQISGDVLYQAGVSIAKKALAMTREMYPDVGFIAGGARGLHHFTEMVGAPCVVTINWTGTADHLIKADLPVVQRFLCPTPDAVVDELCEKLEDYRRGYFRYAIQPREYDDFGPVVLFRSQFEHAWQSALREIGEIRKKR